MSQLNELQSLVDKLPAKDRAFAADLIMKGRKYGVTPGQAKWVQILIDRARGVSVPQLVGDVGSFMGVYQLFAKALKNLKFPKVRLQVDGHPIVLSVAGAKSANPGVVNVTDGAAYPGNRWYGRVMPDGSWQLPNREYAEIGVVGNTLKKLAEAPEATAAEYGRLTGRCAFCNLPLKDDHSVAVGYGPVCAEKWGLKANWKAAKPVLPALEVA